MGLGKGGGPTPRTRGGEHQRSHMAQLCRGFLVLCENDFDRARAFLVAFLRETQRPETDD